MSFLLTGQTDAGKSTISGHLLYQVGYFQSLSEEDQRYYRKYLDQIPDSDNKSRFSILMDLLDGEILSNKTKTQDFNICTFKHEDKTYTLIDTPGHKLYIRSLISGLFHLKLDLICLVVSSLDNEFAESFQRGTTKEDLLLARSTGCVHLLVLWNKSDIQPPSKSSKDALQQFVKKLSFKKIYHLPISAYDPTDVLQLLPIVNESTNTSSSSEVKVSTSTTGEDITTTKLITEGMIFIDQSSSPPTLLSPGYVVMVHGSFGEVEAEIVKIKDISTNKVVKFINDTTRVKLLLQLNEPIRLANSSRVIFRNADTTLGFGLVVSN
jgi:GTPase